MKRTYVFMFRDECGDETRAYGTDFLEAEHTFSLDAPEEIAEDVLRGWLLSMEAAAQHDWEEKYGSECRVFVEETHDSQLRNMTAYERASLFDSDPFDGWTGDEIAEHFQDWDDSEILGEYGEDMVELVRELREEYPEYF